MDEVAEISGSEASLAPGWRPDPCGRHDYRYWSGTGWLKHVRDDGVASVDAVAPGVVLEDTAQPPDGERLGGLDLPRAAKVVLLVATAWPIAYALFFLGLWVYAFSSIALGWYSAGIERLLLSIGPAHGFTIALTTLLVFLYVYLVVIGIERRERLLWLVVVLLGGIVGQLLFFFVRVWPDPAPRAT